MQEQQDLIKNIFRQHENCRSYKSGLGKKGLIEQTKQNERFYSGDQWHGAKVGGDRPLVRHNVIKRIGEYKTAVIGTGGFSVEYSALGLDNTSEMVLRSKKERGLLASGKKPFKGNSEDEARVVMSVLSDYFNVQANRLELYKLCAQMLKKAYISGTGVLYTYWDNEAQTGLYADDAKTVPIKGDIAVQLLDIENVDFGNPNECDVQKQPYIIISQRMMLEDALAMARANGANEQQLSQIKADDDTGFYTGGRSVARQEGCRKVTVLTKLWKAVDETGKRKVFAVCVCKGCVLKPQWSTGIELYPLSVFSWQERSGCIYGESEITHLIPNQIAINRMLTASVWAIMVMGMPIMMVNSDLVHQTVTNNPGQIIGFHGAGEDFANAIKYITPPNFSPSFNENISSLISETLMQSGVNPNALGDTNLNNASAIMASREAAMLPLKTTAQRYYSFIRDIARIWAQYWLRLYGNRKLLVEDENGVWYLPFEPEKYEALVINAKVDAGACSIWNDTQVITLLDNLLDKTAITATQYLERLPDGMIAKRDALIEQLKKGGEAV